MGWFTVTSASQRSSLVPRSAGAWVVSSSGLLDERGRDVPGDEVRVLDDGLQERDVGADATDPELGERPPGPSHRGLEGPAPACQLDQHRVEVGADLHSGVGGAAIQAYAGPTRGAVGGDSPGVGPETVGRVLGGDPALQRGAIDPDVALGQPQVGQALPRGDPHLGLDQVDVGDLLGDRVLDLDPWVHLDEDVLAGPLALGLDQELHRAGTE